jgi:hypothetical protein
MTMFRFVICCVVLIVILGFSPRTSAQAKKDADRPKEDPSLLTLDRIFSSKEFELEKPPATRWQSAVPVM